MTVVAIPDPLFSDGVDLTVVLIVIGKTIAVFALAAALRAHVHLVPAQGDRAHAEPDRARPRRPVRVAPDAGRRHQALLQGTVGAQHRRPQDLLPRAVPVAAPRVPRLCDRAHRRGRRPSPGTRRSSSSPTSPSGVLWLVAMSGLGLYGVLLAGWSSGSKYPLLGSVRASAQLLSYEAAFWLAIVGVLVQANTLSTRGIVDEAGLARDRVDLQRRLVLAAGDRRVGRSS